MAEPKTKYDRQLRYSDNELFSLQYFRSFRFCHLLTLTLYSKLVAGMYVCIMYGCMLYVWTCRFFVFAYVENFDNFLDWRELRAQNYE